MSELVVGSIAGLASNSYVVDVASGSTLDLSAGAVLPTGSIIAVSSVSKTNTFTASLAAGAYTAVTDLSITHSVSSPTNKVLLMCQIGNAAGENDALLAAFAFAEDGSLINIGDADGSRTRVGAGFTNGILNGPGDIGSPVFMSYLHTPGAGSKTYTVQVFNAYTLTRSVYVNRSASAVNDAARVRSASNFILMEVAG